jgi:hypothetical protein
VETFTGLRKDSSDRVYEVPSRSVMLVSRHPSAAATASSLQAMIGSQRLVGTISRSRLQRWTGQTSNHKECDRGILATHHALWRTLGKRERPAGQCGASLPGGARPLRVTELGS